MRSFSGSNESVENKIKAEAFRLGFSLCGITTTAPTADYTRFERWLGSGFHAGMQYLTSPRHRELRREPVLLVPEAKTILSLGWSYPIRMNQENQFSTEAWVAGYASGVDYHRSLIEKMYALSMFIRQELGKEVDIQGFTDSAPILEREIGSRAGLGWIGKNSCLISPTVGSSFLLAELFISAPLLPNQPFQKDFCGTCTKCLDACPTSCIRPDRTIDSSRCLSYLTIEHKGMIPESLRPMIGNWIFGCDICQMVCPWNQKTAMVRTYDNLISWRVDHVLELLSLTPSDFTNRFSTSAISRTRWKGLLRNALVFLGNHPDKSTLPHLEVFLRNTSDDVLLETANWAKREIINHGKIS